MKVELVFSHDPFAHHAISMTGGLCHQLGGCEALGAPEEHWVTPVTISHEIC